jgi:glycosyltransferase involved in cell wall biosynthesis
MRILMCNSFYYLRGGAERCVFDLSALLTAHGHDVIPFAMQHERNYSSEYNEYFVSAVDYPSKLRISSSLQGQLSMLERVIYSREAKHKIARLIADTGPDIVHIHGIAHELSPSVLDAIKQAGIPIVQTLHDYKLLCPNTSFVSNGKVCERCKTHRYYQVMLHRCKRGSLLASVLAGVEMYVHKLLRIYEKNVDLFIAPSQFLQRKVREYGIKSPIEHLPNFINMERFQPCYEPDDYFIYVGRLIQVKGIHTLLEAMRQIQTSHLYIVGGGEMDAELRSFVQQHGLTNVSFLGHLDTEKLILVMQRAAFSVVPSEWYENYPMSVVESLACGTPVIGSRIGGIPEIIKDGHNGLLFEPGNAGQLAEKILDLLSNPQRTIMMGRQGRQQVQTVNHPEQHYKQTMQFYRRLVPITERQ